MTLRPAKVNCGMALGWDQALAEAAVLEGIPFDAYVPFLGQESVWPEESKKHYRYLMGKADTIVYVCPPGYAPWKMQKRNEAMVDAAEGVLALWNNSAGGTANCVSYATRKGKPVRNVWGEWVAYKPV